MQTHKRPAVRDRHLDSSVLALKIEDEAKRLKQEPEWISGMENGITLAKYPHMRVVLVALKRGTSLREHKVEGPMSLSVVDGAIDVTVSGVSHVLFSKGLLTLRKTVPYDIRAKKNSLFLMTIMRP